MRIPYSALVLQPSHRYAPKNRRCYCLLRRRSPGFDLKPKNYTSSVQFVSFLRAEVYFAEETQNSTLKIYAHLFFRGSVEETTTFKLFGSTKKRGKTDSTTHTSFCKRKTLQKRLGFSQLQFQSITKGERVHHQSVNNCDLPEYLHPSSTTPKVLLIVERRCCPSFRHQNPTYHRP